jgi:predicted HTH transcriptional regulator
MQCRHLDGNSKNNNLSNLKWGTPRENQQDRNIHGTGQFGSKNPIAKLNEYQVKIIKILLKSKKFSNTEIAKIFGVTRFNISAIKNKRSWTHIE